LQKYFSSKAEMNNFLFPKPASLIEFLIEMLSLENIFILDFFGGSGTTAESVMKINKKSIQKNMYYICTKKYDFINEGFHNIAEDVMLERISRVSLGKSKDGKSLTSQECP
jgi:adenine-specific DNA-methyltransferase